MRIHKTSFIVIVGGMTVVTSVLAVWLLLTLMPRSTEARAIALVLPTQSISSQQLRLALHRVGLDAESLAATGVTTQEQIGAVVSAVRTQLASNPNAILDAEMAVGVARQTVAGREGVVQSGTGTAQDVASLVQARSQFATVTSSRDQLVDALFSAGTFTLTSAQQATLSTIRANRASRSCPVEFLVASRSDATWVALTSALAVERIALKRGTSVDANTQAFLADARSEPAVAAAASNLCAHAASVLEAWNAFTTIVN